MQNGKGDARRPAHVPPSTVRENWDRTFRHPGACACGYLLTNPHVCTKCGAIPDATGDTRDRRLDAATLHRR